MAAEAGKEGTEKAQNLGDKVSEATGETTDKATSPLSALAQKGVVIPLAVSAATIGAVVAAKKAGVGSKLENAGTDKAGKVVGEVGRKGLQEAVGNSGGKAGIAGSLLSKAIPGMGGGGGGKGKTRRLQIQRWTDVAAPRQVVYERWTEYEDYPKFMHRVLSVELEDEEKAKGENGELTWQEKIWFSKRQWKAEITEQRKNELIAWKTVSGTGHTGVVTFHELDDNLTRVLVTMDFTPSGMMEKMASGLRFVKRAVQADLARFKTKVEFEVAGLAEEQEKRQEEGAPGTDAKKPGKDKDEDKDEESPRAEQDGETGDDENRDREAERREREERRESRREQVSA